MRRKVYTLTLGALLSLTGPGHAQDLVDIYKQALERDPQMSAAVAANRAAKELDNQARAAVMPKASASAQRSETDTEYNNPSPTRGISAGDTVGESSTNYSLDLQQPLFNRQAFVAMDQADARINQADAEFVAAKQAIITRVADAYFNLLAAQDSLEFAEAEKTAVQQQLRQTRQRFEVGLTAVTDVREAQARYDLTLAQEIAARNQLDTAREQLREITGEGYADVAPLVDAPLEVPDPEDIDAWVDTALTRNLQLLAAQAAVRQATLEINRRKAARWPTVDLVGSYGHSENPSFGLDTDSTSLVLQLNAPFYQGGLISSQAQEAAYLLDQSKSQLEQQRRATVRQTRDAYLAVQAGISQVKALRRSLESAQTAVEATQAGFEVGTRTAVDVLNAQRELFRAKRDLARARYDYVLARLNLKQAAGVLSADDVEEVNRWLGTSG